MPGNIIRIGKGLPVKFYRVSPPVDQRYNTVYWDQDWFKNTIRDFQDRATYFQKWQRTDNMPLQLEANYDPISIDLIRCDGSLVASLPFEKVPTAIVGQPYSTYELTISWADYPDGYYYLLLKGGFGETVQLMVSEGIDLRLKHPDTVLLEYSNSFNKGGIVWDTGIKMNFRVEGIVSYDQPGSEDVLYIDQPHNVVPLSSTPFDLYSFAIGSPFGVPVWVIDKLNQLFSFDTVTIDGRGFAKAEGAKFEKTEVPNYPMYGWTIQLSPTRNLDFEEYDDEFDDEIVVAYNIETTLFGTFPPGDETISIIENE
ncbi:hypothetical protein ACFOTA_06920 [Chitinophaga sp. GCM10012297]|uniref:Uncharacterized protein n=1 Tax=Chitinophaga chungangae TaxID=2821488 RepID=A0ABS3YBA4_9BACT|nr:hypothetical protein [Chitinophaga chungangae]MBO9151931.1 hypothetical protein [Chitinophaga chungangae]